jgi:hypothetical protein
MSMKNDYLLRRSGRNQYGDAGTPEANMLNRVGRTTHDEAMWGLHRQLHKQLVERYGSRWLGLFAGKSKKAAWRDFSAGTGRAPALTTFYKQATEYATFDEYLLYLMVSDIRLCLDMLGVPQAEINSELIKYAECGRYHVNYGTGTRIFGTRA